MNDLEKLALEALTELVSAMRLYEGEAETEAPLKHRNMMAKADQAIAALTASSGTAEQQWENAGEISEAAKKRYDELSYKEWDWRSFHNGFLEGAEAALQRGRDEEGALRTMGDAVLAVDPDTHGSDLSGLSEEMATQVRLCKASGGTDVAGYIRRLTVEPQSGADVREIDDDVVAFVDELTESHDINPMVIGLWYALVQAFLNSRLAQPHPTSVNTVVSEPIGWTWVHFGDRHFTEKKPDFGYSGDEWGPKVLPVYTAPQPSQVSAENPKSITTVIDCLAEAKEKMESDLADSEPLNEESKEWEAGWDEAVKFYLPFIVDALSKLKGGV